MVRKTIAAIAFSVFTVGSAQALTIDDFSISQSLSDPGVSAGVVLGPTTSIVGGHRDASITRTTGADPATLAFNSGGTGTMSIANGTGGTSFSQVNWGFGGGGLGGVDLTVGGTQDALDLRIVANDFAADIQILVIDTSFQVSFLNLNSPGGIPGPSSVPLLFEYASFSGFADFTSIDLITLIVDTSLNNATDIELDFLGTTTTEVAEPETLLILGLGLAGLGFARRRLR